MVPAVGKMEVAAHMTDLFCSGDGLLGCNVPGHYRSVWEHHCGSDGFGEAVFIS